MAIYRYQAFNSKARLKKGVIQAESKSDAIEKIKSQSLVLTQISKEKVKKREPKLSLDVLIDFCQEMACLLRAKLPLFDCLKLFQERYRNLSNHTIFVFLIDGVKNGHSLSSLLKKFPTTFDRVFVSCIQGAENSSRLDKSFENLYELLTYKKKMKKELFGVCAYPLSLLGFGLLMTFFLLLGFVPQIADLFEGKALHPMSLFVINLSQWMNNSLFSLMLGTIFFSFVLIFLVKYKKTSILIKTFFTKLPLIHRIAKSYNMARITRLFSLLLSENVPLLTAIKLVSTSYNKTSMFESLKRVEQRILNGVSFSRAIETEPLFDKVFVQMMKIGQETGDLAGMTRQAFEIYDQELKSSFNQLKKVLQPALLLLLAILIGFILLATLLPLTDAANIL